MKKSAILLSLVASLSTGVAQAEEPDSSMLDGYNRAMFKFNDKVDGWVLKPLAKGYRAVTPDVVETGVSNFFSNLGELINIPNDLLQGKFRQAANDTGRLLVNSTIGIGGLFEIADKIGLEKSDGEDFGQTLATWGVPSGPYVVIPVLGPSTLRDFPGTVTDSVLFSPIGDIENVSVRNSVYGLKTVDTRAGLLKSEELITGDRYTFIKGVYLQRREYLINDGEVEDDFGGDSDEYGSEDEF